MKTLEVKVWKDRERIEALREGEVAQMCDESSIIDGHFKGLFLRKENGRYVMIGRQIISKDNILMWRLSGRGCVYSGWFLFDGINERYLPKLIGKKSTMYKEYNKKLEEVGL